MIATLAHAGFTGADLVRFPDEAAPRIRESALYREAGADRLTQALADRDVNLTDLQACRFAMIEAFGVEPDVNWLEARNLASDLRQGHRAAESARTIVRHTCVVGLAGLFLIVGANVAFAAGGVTAAEWEVLRALAAGAAGVALVGAAAWWIERFLAARIDDGSSE